MGDREDNSVSPVPSQEECDAAYSKARTSLDGRAAPFVPGVGRLSQDFSSISIDLGDTSPPDESEPEDGYRRGSGGLVVRSHKNVVPLTAALGVNAAGSGEATVPGQETKASPNRRRSGSGGLVVRSHRNVAPLPLDTQVKTSPLPERTQEQDQEETETGETMTKTNTSTASSSTGRSELSEISKMSEISSPPPPSIPSRAPPPPEQAGADGDCDCGSTDPVTKASAWEQTAPSSSSSSPILNGEGTSGGSGSSNSTSGRVSRVTVSPAETLDIRIFCGTWNVAGRKLDSSDDMAEWLDVDKLDGEGGGEGNDPPDLFVVGFQEVVELSAQNVVMDRLLDTQSRSNSLLWFTQVYAYLVQYGQRHGVKYSMVSEQRMLGTYILVMATETLSTKIAHVQCAVVQTGLGGYFGNKGAVAVRMEVAGASSLCFVCAHMAAHREHVEARNNEYKLISSKPVFADTTGRLPTDESEDVTTSTGTGGSDKDKKQGGVSTWGSLFAGAGQGGRSGGMSPTRSSEVKRAIRAAMAFGLPKGGSGGEGAGAGGESGRSSPTAAKDNEPEMDVDLDGAGKGKGTGDSGSGDGGAGRDDGAEDLPWEPSVRHMDADLPKTKTILQADIVFWLGDLNYRIAEDVPDQVVFEMLGNDNLEFLRGKDQLNIARASGAAFHEFQEGPLCFPPTYKYIPGTKDFDTRPEKKVRCPSWCDRVLYSVGMQSGDSVKRLGLDRYWSSGPLVSDHMPVSALFRTSLACAPEKSVDEPEMEVESLSLSPRRAAAQVAFESTPFARVTLEPPALEMVLEPMPLQSATVTIANAGGLKGRFHVCKDSLPDWMSLDGDDRGELGPGETVEIRVEVAVADAQAAAEKESNSGPRQAYAMLRVEVDGGGSGTFLPVVCTFSDL